MNPTAKPISSGAQNSGATAREVNSMNPTQNDPTRDKAIPTPLLLGVRDAMPVRNPTIAQAAIIIRIRVRLKYFMITPARSCPRDVAPEIVV